MPFILFDAHCDTIQKICDSNQELMKNSLHVSLENMRNNQHIQVFAAFIDKKNDLLPPFERCNSLIDCYYNQIHKYQNHILHCKCISDIMAAISAGKTASILSVEGGEALEGKIENVEYFFKRGVRMMTLCWNYKNELGCGVLEDDKTGLSGFGRSVVCEMNRLGMAIDVSHICENGFWDVIETSSMPVVASHSNAFSLKNNKRNLTDEQIKAIIKCDGCIGINLYREFLGGEDADIYTVIRHIEHILELGGENNIGFGSDFDGMDLLPCEIKGIIDLNKIPEELSKVGYSRELIEKVTYKNFMRVLGNVFKEI